MYMFGVVTIATYENYYKCPDLHIFYYFGIVYIDLVVMWLFTTLPYMILLSFTLKIFFPVDFNLIKEMKN